MCISVVNCVLESVTSLVFFHSVKERAVSLSVTLGRAVKTADLVDHGAGRQRGRRGGIRPGEDVPKGGAGGEGDVNVMVVQDLLDGFGEGGMECLDS